MLNGNSVEIFDAKCFRGLPDLNAKLHERRKASALDIQQFSENVAAVSGKAAYMASALQLPADENKSKKRKYKRAKRENTRERQREREYKRAPMWPRARAKEKEKEKRENTISTPTHDSLANAMFGNA